MLCTPKGDEPEGKHHGYALGSTQGWSWRGEKKERRATTLKSHFSFCSIFFFLFCKHKQSRYSLSSALEQTAWMCKEPGYRDKVLQNWRKLPTKRRHPSSVNHTEFPAEWIKQIRKPWVEFFFPRQRFKLKEKTYDYLAAIYNRSVLPLIW